MLREGILLYKTRKVCYLDKFLSWCWNKMERTGLCNLQQIQSCWYQTDTILAPLGWGDISDLFS